LHRCLPVSSVGAFSAVIGLARTAAILSAIILGALVPQGHVLAGAIRWLVMAMLFLVFLQTTFSWRTLHRTHVYLLVANIALGFGGWGLGWLIGGRDVALAAFFCGITPTAIAAPVIISFLRGRVDFVVGAFLLTNVSIAALLPLLLPIVLGQTTPEAFAQVLASVGLVVFVPMTAAWFVRLLHPPASVWPVRLRNVSFGMWVTSMFLITSNASDFLHRQSDTPQRLLLKIALASLLVCIGSFVTGRLIGGSEFQREASQSLGQKNTTFTIYLALTYASPVVALGPTFYVIWHNLWNSWQLHLASRHPADPTSVPVARAPD
jgi:BASS family bile acid:Na+ symporter